MMQTTEVAQEKLMKFLSTRRRIDESFFSQFPSRTRIEKTGFTGLDLEAIEEIEIPLQELTFSEKTQFSGQYQTEISSLIQSAKKSFFSQFIGVKRRASGLKIAIAERIDELDRKELDISDIRIVSIAEFMKNQNMLQNNSKWIAKKKAFPYELTNMIAGKHTGIVSELDTLLLYYIPTLNKNCWEYNPRRMTVEQILEDMEKHQLRLDLVIFPSYFQKDQEEEKCINEAYKERFQKLGCIFFSAYFYDLYFVSGRHNFLNHNKLEIASNLHEMTQYFKENTRLKLLNEISRIEKTNKIKAYERELKSDKALSPEKIEEIYYFLRKKIYQNALLVPGGNHIFYHEGDMIYQGGVHDNIAGIAYVTSVILLCLKQKKVSLDHIISLMRKTSKQIPEEPNVIRVKSLLQEIV